MTHGHLSATVKGYARRRRDEWRRTSKLAARATGRPNIAGWERLAALTAQAGLPLQQGGDRLVEAAA